MTNQNLHERFKLEGNRAKSVIVSQIIAAAIEQSDIKAYDNEDISKHYAQYVPFWT